MIGFVVNDFYLALPTGYRIMMEYNNPAYYGSDEGSSSFPMELPLTPEAKKAIQHAYALAVRNKVIEFDAVQELNKILLSRGKLVLTQIVDNTAKGVFVVNGFNRDALGLRLRDISMGKEVLGDTSLEVVTEAWNRNTLLYPATDFVFPVHYNEAFYDGNNADYLSWINPFDFAGGSNLLRNTTTNKYSIVPWVFAQFVLQQIAAAVGYTIAGDFVRDANQQQLLVFSNVALDLIPTAITATADSLTHSQLIGGASGTNPKIILYDYAGSGWNAADSTWDYLQPGDYTVDVIIPCENPALGGGPIYYRFRIIRVSDGLVAYEKVDFVTFDPNPAVDEDITFSDTFTMPVSPDDVFYFSIKFFTTVALSTVQAITISDVELELDNAGSVGLNIYNPVVDISQHLPDITVADFITGLCETFNLRIDYNLKTKQLELNYIDAAYTSTKQRDVTDSYEQRFTLYFEENGRKLEFAFTDAEKGRSHWRNLHQNGYTSGNGKTTYIPKAGALLQEHQPMPVSATTQSTLVPYLCNPGTSSAFSLENETPYRLAYWYGLQSNDDSTEYAFASSLNEDQLGNVIGNVILRLSMDAYCLVRLYHQRHLAALALQEEVERKRTMSQPEALELDWNEQQIIGGQHYILKQRRLELGSTSIIATDRLIRVK